MADSELSGRWRSSNDPSTVFGARSMQGADERDFQSVASDGADGPAARWQVFRRVRRITRSGVRVP